MLYVYRVQVSFTSGSTKDQLFITKQITKYRVVKSGAKHFTLNPYPEAYNTGNISVPIPECYSDLSDAQVAADRQATELTAVLVNAVNILKAPAEVSDKTKEIVAQK